MSKSVLDLLPVAPKGNIDYNRIREIKVNSIQDCKKHYLEKNGWGTKEGKSIDFYYNTAITVDGKEKVKEHMKSCMESQLGGRKRRRKVSKSTKKIVKRRGSKKKKNNKRRTKKRRS
jgi:hypothetical protein